MLTAFLDISLKGMKNLFGALNLVDVWSKALENTADFTNILYCGCGWHFTIIKVCFRWVDSKLAVSNRG